MRQDHRGYLELQVLRDRQVLKESSGQLAQVDWLALPDLLAQVDPQDRREAVAALGRLVQQGQQAQVVLRVLQGRLGLPEQRQQFQGQRGRPGR